MRAEYLGIEPLNGQNYLRWKGKMKATLVLKGWDDAIDPPTPAASGSTPPLSKNDAKALALIQLCVDESQMATLKPPPAPFHRAETCNPWLHLTIALPQRSRP
jgi:hypothetical protein